MLRASPAGATIGHARKHVDLIIGGTGPAGGDPSGFGMQRFAIPSCAIAPGGGVRKAARSLA